jgi:hypothetical protein
LDDPDNPDFAVAEVGLDPARPVDEAREARTAMVRTSVGVMMSRRAGDDLNQVEEVERPLDPRGHDSAVAAVAVERDRDRDVANLPLLLVEVEPEVGVRVALDPALEVVVRRECEPSQRNRRHGGCSDEAEDENEALHIGTPR